MYHKVVPRTVDHAERRAAITAALNRIAGRDGLRAVTMRSVAAEAGVSVRLVQYYFETKSQLLDSALLTLEAESTRRWQARVATLGDPPLPRVLLEAFLDEALPDDEVSRAFSRAFHSYTDLMLSDPEFTGTPTAGPDRLEAQIAAALHRASDAGQLQAGIGTIEVEAATLLLLSHGLGTSVLIGQRSPAQAGTLWRHHLDRLFKLNR